MDLVLLDEPAQQPVPHDDYVISSILHRGSAVQIVHDGAVIPIQYFHPRAGFLFISRDHPGFGKTLQEPFIAGQPDRQWL